MPQNYYEPKDLVGAAMTAGDACTLNLTITGTDSMRPLGDEWYRFKHDTTPVYLSRKGPTWFVPDSAGDSVLQSLMDIPGGNLSIEEQRFLQRLPANNFEPYTGRTGKYSIPQLRELWFHLTNNCNMSCKHCLFSSGGTAGASLEAEYVLDSATMASKMGCTVFALTGGEPFVHEKISTIVAGLLSLPDSHVVVLTNAVAIPSFVNDIKTWGADRFHLQISIDGMREKHETIRGKGSFITLRRNLALLKTHGIPFTLSMAVSRLNVDDMVDVVAYAADQGASSVHCMWHFVRGRGTQEDFLTPKELYPFLIKAACKAEDTGITIDNIKTLRTQIFSPSGTIHDGSGAGRESAAIGPDKKLYPSAATVGIDALATKVNGSLESAWKNSPVLEQIRSVSIATSDDPWRFYTGGGDFDHSYMHKGLFTDADPYVSLYVSLLAWLIEREANGSSAAQSPSLLLACGELLEQCETNGNILATHSNCLLSVSGDSHLPVRAFYSDAATRVNDDIVNPICYPETEISHIPALYRFRGYGCGSPVIDADIQPGESVVDLGSGRGIECFIASRKAGPTGSVTGIDMLDPMLDISNTGALEVSTALGYNNIRFVKGYLESLPLKSQSVDVVLSNCVLNLSPHKRKTFSEIYRVLKEGGRIVISDVVCEDEPHGGIRNNTTLKGECIAGALRQKDLCGLLEESGYQGFHVIKRFPYRIIEGHQFFSLTFFAHKYGTSQKVRCMYRGPCSSVIAPDGTTLFPGVTVSLPRTIAESMGNQVFLFDTSGAVTNIEMISSCTCALPSSSVTERTVQKKEQTTLHRSGCMVCGEPLVYFTTGEHHRCFYCKQEFPVNALCIEGHYVCDHCHSSDALEVIRRVCMESDETDMSTLLASIRSHSSAPVHGPEHHAMVPAVILAAYINSGGHLPRQIILTAIDRGMQVAGGSCAFSGVCGAASGVGIAFSLILDANPYKGRQRMLVQSAVTQVMQRLSKINAARCCRRDCMLALQCAAEISMQYLETPLYAQNIVHCQQQHENKECQGNECPFFKK